MPPDRLSNLTIVVVEDHDDARRYLGLFLDRLGANVVMASNGFEGLEATKHSRPDLVVSDIINCMEWTVLSCCEKFELLELIPEAVYRLSL